MLLRNDMIKTAEATNTTLREELLEEIAGLNEALAADRREAARMLVNWASNAGNFSASDNGLSSATTSFVQHTSAADAYYEQFLPKKGAVFCSGMSLFLDHLLKIFGYDSFTIDFGDARQGLTHATVIAPFLEATGWKHHIYDPTFNATFHDRDTGVHLDIFEIIDALDTDTIDTVRIVSENVASRRWISIGPCTDSCYSLEEVIGDRYVYSREYGGLAEYLAGNEGQLVANGYASGLRGFVQLMRARMFSVKPSPNEAASEDFVDQLRERRIPLGDA